MAGGRDSFDKRGGDGSTVGTRAIATNGALLSLLVVGWTEISAAVMWSQQGGRRLTSSSFCWSSACFGQQGASVGQRGEAACTP